MFRKFLPVITVLLATLTGLILWAKQPTGDAVVIQPVVPSDIVSGSVWTLTLKITNSSGSEIRIVGLTA